MNARTTRNGRRLRVVEGEACETLCVWEPHVVRSPWEARALAAQGCALASAPSPVMAAFVRAGSRREDERVAFDRGRIHVVGKTAEERCRLRELRTHAQVLGLSHLDSLGTVNVRLRLDQPLDLAALVRVLATRQAASSILRTGPLRICVHPAAHAFQARLRRDKAAGLERRLRLLGFRPASGSYLLPLDAAPYRASTVLTTVLSELVTQREIHASLFPNSAVAALAARHPLPRTTSPTAEDSR